MKIKTKKSDSSTTKAKKWRIAQLVLLQCFFSCLQNSRNFDRFIVLFVIFLNITMTILCVHCAVGRIQLELKPDKIWFLWWFCVDALKIRANERINDSVARKFSNTIQYGYKIGKNHKNASEKKNIQNLRKYFDLLDRLLAIK